MIYMSGRPKEYEDLKNTTLSLEREIIDRCKETGINISDVCRIALIDVLGDPVLRKKYDKFERIPDETKKDVLKRFNDDPATVRGCVNIIHMETGLKITENEFIEWVDRVSKK